MNTTPTWTSDAGVDVLAADGRIVRLRHRSRGIGTLLMERLTMIARRRGITQLVGEVLDDGALALSDARDRVAEGASLGPLLRPRSVAVVGAGRNPSGIGHSTLSALVEYGFTGPLYAVNPHVDSVLGVPSYPRSLPGGAGRLGSGWVGTWYPAKGCEVLWVSSRGWGSVDV